jgi:hypothetical protein
MIVFLVLLYLVSQQQRLYYRKCIKSTSMMNKWAICASWCVLRAIDLSSIGGLNYNGIETVRRGGGGAAEHV